MNWFGVRQFTNFDPTKNAISSQPILWCILEFRIYGLAINRVRLKFTKLYICTGLAAVHIRIHSKPIHPLCYLTRLCSGVVLSASARGSAGCKTLCKLSNEHYRCRYGMQGV